MADSASESDSSSIDGTMMPPSPITREQLTKRIESLQQLNRVLRVELETFKLRVKTLQEENKALRQTSVNIQAKAEQEEEYISNTLMKQIQTLKKEKETLAHTFEQEEECLTNDLSRKLNKLRAEKCKLEQTLEEEQECLVNKLMRKIEKLEAETCAKQTNLDQLRREKVELENTLEQEQEALVNRLWKRMDKLEAEKRNLQRKVSLSESGGGGVSSSSSISASELSNSGSNNGASNRRRSLNNSSTPLSLLPNLQNAASPSSSSQLSSGEESGDKSSFVSSTPSQTESDIISMTGNVQHLRSEVERLKNQLSISQRHHAEKMSAFAEEERLIRDENLRLQRRLQLEMERRENLCRHLSESESSLEMEDERHFHETHFGGSSSTGASRPRPTSSPGPHSRPMSPGSHLHLSMSGGVGRSSEMMSPPSPVGLKACGNCNGHGWLSPLLSSSSSSPPLHRTHRDKFARPAPPQGGDQRESRSLGDSTMSSPSPSPAPFEVVNSPTASSPMDISKN